MGLWLQVGLLSAALRPEFPAQFCLGSNINATVNVTYNGQEYGLANAPVSGAISATLSEGYPALTDGKSLKYLFADNSGYAEKMNDESINGLFKYDETTGAYTFNSRENHAQFNAEDDTFTLYDQLISSNFIWYPFGNFLPFNDIVEQCTQASEIDREYFNAVADRAMDKYSNGQGDEYQTLADSLNSWIALMDAEYTSGWGGAQAMNEYFNVSGPGTKVDKEFDFSGEKDLLDKVYSIDYDEATNFYFGMEMQMQFMQNMCMMPFYMMQNMASMMNIFPGGMAPEKAAPGQAEGFRLGNMEIPPEMLGTLLSMDMSPENLEKLQKLLDIVFEAMPKTKDSNAGEE